MIYTRIDTVPKGEQELKIFRWRVFMFLAIYNLALFEELLLLLFRLSVLVRLFKIFSLNIMCIFPAGS